MKAGKFCVNQLSEHLFWDVDRSTIDLQTHSQFLIRRTMERGTRRDVEAVWLYYGEDSVRQALTEAPSLTRKTIAFFANQFSLPREAFRSYRRSSNWSQ